VPYIRRIFRIPFIFQKTVREGERENRSYKLRFHVHFVFLRKNITISTAYTCTHAHADAHSISPGCIKSVLQGDRARSFPFSLFVGTSGRTKTSLLFAEMLVRQTRRKSYVPRGGDGGGDGARAAVLLFRSSLPILPPSLTDLRPRPYTLLRYLVLERDFFVVRARIVYS